jgi:transposase
LANAQLFAFFHVIINNFNSHKVAGIKEAIEAVDAELVYLSPYSPDFSQV